MSWLFTFSIVGQPGVKVERHPDWFKAMDALSNFIDVVRPPKTYQTLKMETKHFAQEHKVTITDGTHIFAMTPDA